MRGRAQGLRTIADHLADVSARIAACSELPGNVGDAANRFRAQLQQHRARIDVAAGNLRTAAYQVDLSAASVETAILEYRALTGWGGQG